MPAYDSEHRGLDGQHCLRLCHAGRSDFPSRRAVPALPSSAKRHMCSECSRFAFREQMNPRPLLCYGAYLCFALVNTSLSEAYFWRMTHGVDCCWLFYPAASTCVCEKRRKWKKNNLSILFSFRFVLLSFAFPSRLPMAVADEALSPLTFSLSLAC